MLTFPDFNAKKVVIIFTIDGDKVSFQNDNLVIKDKTDTTKLQLSCYKLFALFIVGGISLTSGIIERSKKFGFSIFLFSIYLKLYATIGYCLDGNTLLHKKQYFVKNSSDIAKSIIINKIINQKNTILKMRDGKNTEILTIFNSAIEKLKNDCCDIYSIMGIEGTVAKAYFNKLYKNNNWKGRFPRVKCDKINLLLDIGYTLLFNFIEAILGLFGFDLYIGNLHQEFYKRKSLVCDIIEPFRPIIDYKIKKMLNYGQVDEYIFFKSKGTYGLNFENSKKIISLFLEEILNYKDVIFLYIQNYYRWFMKEKEILYFPKVEIK